MSVRAKLGWPGAHRGTGGIGQSRHETDRGHGRTLQSRTAAQLRYRGDAAERIPSTKRDDALALIKTIEDDDYRKFAEVTAADLNKAADAERAQIEKIKANVADGAPEGFGVVLLKTDSPNLCLAVGGELPSHRQLLLRDEHKLNLEMQTEVVIKDTNIDDAFVDVQKRQCGAVYASAADLKTLTAALTRNDIAYTFSTLWYLPADVERKAAELAEKARIAAQEETERRNEMLISRGSQDSVRKTLAPRKPRNRCVATEIWRQRKGGGRRPKFGNRRSGQRTRTDRSRYFIQSSLHG